MSGSLPSHTPVKTQSVHLAEAVDGIATSWLPLSTPFSADPICKTMGYHNNKGSPFDSIFIAFDPNFTFYRGSTSVQCVATEVESWYNQPSIVIDSPQLTEVPTITSLSPVVCPLSWFTALSSVIRSTITAVTCCPSGYTADPLEDHGIGAICGSKISPGSTFGYFPNSGPVVTATTFPAAIDVAAVAIKGWDIGPEVTSVTSATSSSPSPLLPASAKFPDHSVGIIVGLIIGVITRVGILGVVGRYLWLAFVQRRRTARSERIERERALRGARNQLRHAELARQSQRHIPLGQIFELASVPRSPGRGKGRTSRRASPKNSHRTGTYWSPDSIQ